jgi:pyrimidine deaminase RibD-like protein
VGAVLVSASGRVLATGYSRELPGNTHAEECALIKAGFDADRAAAAPARSSSAAGGGIAEQRAATSDDAAAMEGRDGANAVRGATMYTTMEPCSFRLSGKTPCADRLLAAGVARVVVAIHEPPHFVEACTGVHKLRDASLQVDVLDDAELQALARAPNAHLDKRAE